MFATVVDMVVCMDVVAWRRLDDVPDDGLPWLLGCAQRIIASAVADGGTLVTPRLRTATPAVSARAMKPSTARGLAQMLRQVVTHGTATSANVRGLQIAGQTATAVHAHGADL
jgi:hypothetical protein